MLIDATPVQNEHRRRGIGRYVASLIEALADSGLTGWSLLAYPERPIGVQGSRVPARTPRRLEFHGGWVLNEVLVPLAVRRARAGAFHATDPRAVPDPSVVREVVTIYDLTPSRDPAVWAAMWPDQRLGYRRMLSNARRAPVIIAISGAVREDVIESLGVEPDRVCVVHPPVNPHRWAAADPSLERSGILFVGAPDPHKNLQLVFEALALVSVDRRPALTVVGPWSRASEARATNEARSRGLAAPRFERMVSDERLAELYRASAALVMPSRREGFGLPVAEAMAAGCPVIASDIPSIAEVAGDAAVLLPLEAAAWAEAIVSLAWEPEPRQRLAEEGRRRAAEFSPARSVEQLRAAYRRLGVDLATGSEPSCAGPGAP